MNADRVPPWPTDPDSLLPAIVQDVADRSVRMLGWMNAAAYERTLETGRVTFWSRSRERLWTKGETSGHLLELVDLAWDCDSDALLVSARAAGPTCHTGMETCWGDPEEWAAGLGSRLERLAATVAARDADRPEGSYTARLLAAGLARCGAKLVEEAGESAVAALAEGPERLAEEAADVVYHLLVLLRAADVSTEDVARSLSERARG